MCCKMARMHIPQFGSLHIECLSTSYKIFKKHMVWHLFKITYHQNWSMLLQSSKLCCNTLDEKLLLFASKKHSSRSKPYSVLSFQLLCQNTCITNPLWSHLHINFLSLLLPKIVQFASALPFSWPSMTTLEVFIYLEHESDSHDNMDEWSDSLCLSSSTHNIEPLHLHQ
jgi:hypothetical protein